MNPAAHPRLTEALSALPAVHRPAVRELLLVVAHDLAGTLSTIALEAHTLRLGGPAVAEEALHGLLAAVDEASAYVAQLRGFGEGGR